MSAAGEERARLDARSAQLRAKVGDLLGDFEARTEQLRQAQQAAAAVRATLTSPDGTVRVTMDSTGMVTDLHLTPNAFDRTRPETLARTISDLLRRATIQVRKQTSDLMRPLTQNLPDLSDINENAPSLSDMLPKIPEYPTPDPNTPGHPAPTHQASPAPAPVPTSPTRRPPTPAADDEMPTGWMKDDDF